MSDPCFRIELTELTYKLRQISLEAVIDIEENLRFRCRSMNVKRIVGKV
jgi:hypothetical protein